MINIARNHHKYLKSFLLVFIFCFGTYLVEAQNDPVITVPLAATASINKTLLIGENQINIVDVDGDNQTVTLSLGNALLGSITLGTTTGLSGITGDGGHVVSFSGNLVDINAALSDIEFVPFLGGIPILFTVDTDDGTARFDSQNFNIAAQANDNALSFAGDDDRITVSGGQAFFNTNPGVFTYESWVLVDDDGDGPWSIFEIAGTNTLIVIESNGSLVARDISYTSTEELRSNPGAFPIDGNWHHVAIVDDGISPELMYIDGVSVPVSDNFNTFDTGSMSADVLIGDRNSINGFEFSGKLDELRIWSIPRTGVEILTGMDFSFTGNETGLELYLRLDEGVPEDNNTGVSNTLIATPGPTTTIVNFAKMSSASNWVYGQNYYPEATTSAATGIGGTVATLNGDAIDGGGDVIAERGFVYSVTGTNPLPVISGTGVTKVVEGGTTTGSFMSNISSLLINTNYTYRSYVTTSGNILGSTSYGEVVTFMTANLAPPSLTTDPATNLTSVSATLGGEVTSDGGSPTISERGIVYSLTSDDVDPELMEANVTDVQDAMAMTGTFIINVSGLTPGETYAYRTYATNAEGTGYGSVETFTLAPTPTLSPGDIAFTMIDASGGADESFAFVALKTLPNGTEIHFTDNGYDADISNFVDPTLEGFITLTLTQEVTIGDQILINVVNTPTAALKSGGSAGTLSSMSGSFAFNTFGDNLFAWQGIFNSSTDYAIGGFVTGVLTGFSGGNMDLGGTEWTIVADNDDFESELPSDLTNAVNAVSLSTAIPTDSRHIYNFVTVNDDAAVIRTAVNDRDNWMINLPGEAPDVNDLGTFIINDPPILTLDATPAIYNENDPEIQISPGATLTDTESNFDGGSIQVEITINEDVNDRLQISAIGDVSFVGLNIQVSGMSVGTAVGALTSTAAPLDINLNSMATDADVTKILQAITFDNSSDDPGSDTRTVTFTVFDDAGDSDIKIIEVGVIPVNDNPTLTTLGGPIEFTNEDIEVEIVLADILGVGDENDVDGIINAVRVTTLTSGDLNIGTSSGSATPFMGGNDIIDVSTNAYWTPPADDFGFLGAFEVVVVDDLSAESSPPVQASVTVNSVNDDPVITAPSTVSTNQSTAFTFTGGTLISIADVELDALTVNLQTTNNGNFSTATGVINATASGSAMVVNNNTSFVTITGPIADVNSTLDGVQYVPNGIAGQHTIDVSVDDGNGGMDAVEVFVNVSGTFEVGTNTNDIGLGSLREAIHDANLVAGALDIIQFTGMMGGVIILGSDLPDITDDLTIIGPGADNLVITGQAAFQLFDITAAANFNISGITLADGNSATVAGAINFEFTGSTLNIDGVHFDNNSTDSSGGAIRLTSGTAVIDNSLFTQNFAQGNGGAISLSNGGVESLTINNSTFYQNVSNNVGGAISSLSSDVTTLNHVTMHDNTAVVRGDGIDAAAIGTTFNINYCIIFGNGSEDISLSGVAPVDAQNTENVVGTVVNGTLSNDTNVTDGSSSLSFGTLDDNGGTTLTLKPSGIEAVNAATGSSEAFDQIGNARPRGAANDLGALEREPVVPTFGVRWIDANPTDGTIDQVQIDFFTSVFLKDANTGASNFDAFSISSGAFSTSELNYGDNIYNNITSLLIDVTGLPSGTGAADFPDITYATGGEVSVLSLETGDEILNANTPTFVDDSADPLITGVVLDPNNAFVDVTFSELVFNMTGGTGALEEADFVLSVSGGIADVTSAIPTSISDLGGNTYRLTFTLDMLADGNETLTVDLVDGSSVFDANDNPASATQNNNDVSLNDQVVPNITNTTVAFDNTFIDVTFNEGVFTNTGASGALVPADFNLSVVGGVADVTSPTPTGVSDQGGNVYRITFNLTTAADGSEVLTVVPADGASIFDAADNPAAATQTNNVVALNDNILPSITSSSLAADNTYIDVNFNEPVFTTTGGAGALVVADFQLSVSGGTADVTSPTPTSITDLGGNSYRLFFTLDAAADGSEVLTADPADGASIFDAADNPADAMQSNNTHTLNDQAAPAGYTVAFDQSGVNAANVTTITFTFAGAEVGATYDYTIDDASMTGPETGSGVIATATDQIGPIDLSALLDETLTLSVTLTDAALNVGSAATDMVTKDVVAPTGNSSTVVAISNTQIDLTVNVDEISTAYYAIYTTQQSGGSPSVSSVVNGDNSPFSNGNFAIPMANTDITANLPDSYADNQLYYIYIVAEDQTGNFSTVGEETVTTFDTDSPGINAQSVENIQPTTIDLRINLTENATVYFIARSITGAATPTPAEVISGIDGSDVTGFGAYSSPGSPFDIEIEGLTSNTAYDIFWFAEDGSVGANQTAVQEINTATTADTQAPNFNQFFVDNVGITNADINVELDDIGTIFYIFQLTGDPVPSNAQVISGDGAIGATVQQSGSFPIPSATSLITETVNFLPSNTNLDVYVVVVDDSDNNRIAPVFPEAIMTQAVAATNNITITAPTVELCVGDDFVPLGTVAITENNTSAGRDAFNNDNTVVTLILTLPDGIEFNTGASVSVTESGNDDFPSGGEPSLSSLTSSSITITYRINQDDDVDDITINGLEVKGTVSGISGSLQRLAGAFGGTAIIDGDNPGGGVSHADISVGVSSVAPSPLVVTYCEGDVVQLADFTTNSADFTWYDDFNLTNEVYSGLLTDPETDLDFAPGMIDFDVNVPDTYSYFVTNTASGSCPSTAVQVDIVVNPTPVADAGGDKVVCAGEELFIGGFPSLVSTGAVGTHTYQWRSEAALRAVDENFDAGQGTFSDWLFFGFTGGGMSAGSALAFNNSTDAWRIDDDEAIVSPGFTVIDATKPTLFFWARAESVGAVGAGVAIFISDQIDGTNSTTLDAITINSETYQQYAVDLKTENYDQGATLYVRFQYDNLGGQDVAFVFDDVVVDLGITNFVDADKSNPFFTPPSNSAGMGDLVYNIELTIVDPNGCNSIDIPNADDYTVQITAHDKISPSISFEDPVGNPVEGSVGINTEFLNLIINPPATTAPMTQDPGVEFTGTGISFNSATDFYEFTPSDAGGGDFNITYTYTESDTGDNCEESVQTSISVVASLLDGLVLSNCEDVSEYDINPSQDLVDQLTSTGDSFLDLRYPNGASLDFTGTFADPGPNQLPIFKFNPATASAANNIAIGELYGPLSIEIVTTNTGTTFIQSVDVVPVPSVGMQVYDVGNAIFSSFATSYCETDAAIQLTGIVRSTGDISSSTIQLTDTEDNGVFSISNNGGMSFTPLAGNVLDPTALTPGGYIVRYTSDISNDPAVEGGAGCTNFTDRAITIFAQPTIPSLSTETYADAINPDLASNVSLGLGSDMDANGAASYHFVLCSGDALPLIYTEFTDVAPFDGIQDSPNTFSFRWYEEDTGNPGNPDFASEFFPGVAEDQSIVLQTDLLGSGTPAAGEYRFYFTRQSVSGGCESTTREIIIDVIADPVTHVLESSSGFFDDTANNRQVREYCEGETVQDIAVNITSPAIGSDDILWFDNTLTPIVFGDAVSPVDLGLGTGIPSMGTTTPPVNSVQSTSNAEIDYVLAPGSVSLTPGEEVIFYTDIVFNYTFISGTPFSIGEVVTTSSGAVATVKNDFGGSTDIEVHNIDNTGGFFQFGDVITGANGGQATLNSIFFDDIFDDIKGTAVTGTVNSNNFTITSLDPFGLGLTDINEAYAVLGNISFAQLDPTSVEFEVTIEPYTFYFARLDEFLKIGSDAGEDPFQGCPGTLTKVDILVYPNPSAPEPDAVFDTDIYACEGDITNSTFLRSPVGLNPDKIYTWYEGEFAATPFADTYNEVDDDDEDITFATVASTGPGLSVAFDPNTPGTTTYYLSQIDFADKAGGSAITTDFVGCESGTRTPVNITVFALPDAPTLNVTDDMGDPVSIASSALPNSDITYSVCAAEITAGYTFMANTTYMGSNGQRFNWYTVNPGTGALETLIGTFSGGMNPDPATDLGLVGVTGAQYFGITQTTDIIDGEFDGCESAAIRFAVNINTIPAAPTPSVTEFFICFGEEVQTGDIDVTGAGDEAYWYSDELQIGNPMARLTNTFDPSGAVLGLSNTTAPGSYTFFVTQATNIDNGAVPSFAGCESPDVEVTVIIESIEAGPTLISSQLERTICEGESFPALSVTSPTANSYQWYRDDAGLDPIAGATGASYLPVVGDFGAPEVVGGDFVADFSIYVGQFTGVSDCPSNLTQIDLSVYSTPVSPVTTADASEDVYEICQNGAFINPAVDVPGLLIGEQYNWYSQSDLDPASLVATGITFNITTNELDPTVAGSTNFWVAKTENIGTPAGFAGCEGPATMITYTVNELPILDGTQDNGDAIPTEICIDNGSIDLLGGLETGGLPNAPDDMNTFGTWSGLGITDGSLGTATFDPVTAVGDPIFLDQDADVTLTFSFTDEKGCVNSIDHIITINGLPNVSISVIDGLGVGLDEYCIDDAELRVTGNATGGDFSNPINNSAIDNSVGGDNEAEIDLLDAFETVDPTLNSRQVDYVITYTFTDGNGCQNSTDITIKINNTPEPDFLIQRNNATLPASGGVDLEVCVDDVSTNAAAVTDRITLIDDTDQMLMGTLVTGDYSATTTGVTLGSASLEKAAEGQYYFYPAAAVSTAVAENPTSFGNATFIDFDVTYTFTNDVSCTGLSTSKVIRVYKSPNPTISIEDGGSGTDEIEVCIVDGSSSANLVEIYRSDVQFDDGGSIGGSGTYTPSVALSASALTLPTGSDDRVILNSELAYTDFGDGLNPLEITIFYTYTSDKSCTDISNTVEVTINPLPTVSFEIPVGPLGSIPEFCIDNPDIQLEATAEVGNGLTNEEALGDGLFTTPFSSVGITRISGTVAQFNFNAAYTTTQGSGDGSNESQDITYTFTDQNGCINTTTENIVINRKPEITIETPGGCNGAAVAMIYNTAAGDPGDPIVSQLWNFDDAFVEDSENESTDVSPLHQYLVSGNYSPSVVVTNDRGCESVTVSKDIVVGEIPDVNFTIAGLCEGDTIIFEASPKSLTFGAIDTLRFDFGDMTDSLREAIDPDIFTLEDFTFKHVYQEPGTYNVELLLATDNQCNRVINKSLTVLPVKTGAYSTDFETSLAEETASIIFNEIINQVDTTGVTETQVVAFDGWYTDLRPLQDKVDNAFGKLPSQFNSWQYGIPNGVLLKDDEEMSHQNVWMTNLDGNFIGGEERSFLYSPCIDISALERPMVSFDQIYHFPDSRDGVVLQYSSDGGFNWVELGDYDDAKEDATGTNWFNAQSIIGNPGQQTGDVIGWAGNLNDAVTDVDTAYWASSRHKLDTIPVNERSSVIFRFALGSDGSAESEGFAIDNFVIKEREKNVLLEQFSSTNNSNSLPVSLDIDGSIANTFTNNADIITINYHTNIVDQANPGSDLSEYDNSVSPAILLNPDPIAIINEEDPSARAAFYGVSAVPTSVLNGNVDFISTTNNPTLLPWRVSDVARSSLEDALFDINIDPNFGSDVNVLDILVTATANREIRPVNPESPTDVEVELALFVAIIEREVTLTNASNGQTDSKNALRKMLPSGLGLRENKVYDLGTQIQVNDTWDISRDVGADDLSVIAFVQNIETSEIYQVVSMDVAGKESPTITSLYGSILGDDYNLFPNPANNEVFLLFEKTTIEVMEWSIYDQTGKIFKFGKLQPGATGFSIETIDFPSGMYFISMGGENLKFSNKKLMITH